MPVAVKNDPNDKSLFSNEGVKELIPPPNFDYRTHELDLAEVEGVIARVTNHLVHLKASDPRFTYTRTLWAQWATCRKVAILTASRGWTSH